MRVEQDCAPDPEGTEAFPEHAGGRGWDPDPMLFISLMQSY